MKDVGDRPKPGAQSSKISSCHAFNRTKSLETIYLRINGVKGSYAAMFVDVSLQVLLAVTQELLRF